MVRRLILVALVLGVLSAPGIAQAEPCLWNHVPKSQFELLESFRDC